MIRPLFLIPLLIIVFLVCGLVFLPISLLNPQTKIADKIMTTDYKFYAYKIYAEAEVEWPFLKVNLDFQNKYNKAKAIREDYYKTKFAILVYLKDKISQEDISSLVKKLEGMESVTKVHYVSKAEALQMYRNIHKDNPAILELVTEDALPASIEVYLSDWSKQSIIKESIETDPIVELILITPSI